MRQITEVLRLNAQGLSYRQIAQSVGISASTVQSYLERAERAGLSWPLPVDLVLAAEFVGHRSAGLDVDRSAALADDSSLS
jgi:orotate phosphoribosyltransferase-like protein